MISSSIDIDEVYEQFARQVSRILPFDRLSVSVVDQQNGVSIVAYSSGTLVVAGRRPGDSYPLSGSLAGHVACVRSAVLIDDVSADQIEHEFPGLAPGYAAGIRSLLGAPLIQGDSVVGVLQIRSRDPKAYSDHHKALAERVGDQIAGAIANARLRSDLEREAQERDVLAQIGRIISSTLDIDEVFKPFAEQVRKLIRFDRMSVVMTDYELGTATTLYSTGVEIPKWEPNVVHPLDDTIADAIIRTGGGIVSGKADLERLAVQYPLLSHGLASAGLQSRLSVPLVSNDFPLGILTLNSLEPDIYGEKDLELTQRICTHIAAAIANAQLHAQLDIEARDREVLAEIGRIISSSLDLNDVYQRFTDQVSRIIPFDRLTIGIVDID